MTARLLSLILVLAACGPADAPETGSAASPTDGARPDTSMVRDVSPESTLDLIGGELAAVSPSIAIQTVDLWIARLDTVSTDGVPEIRDDLTTLRNLLQSSPLDGHAIGRTLRDLGEQTEALADPGTPLSRLARTLRDQGGRLAPDTTRADTTGAQMADV